MNYAIILAGGIGSRFWPLSRAAEPKQFLKLCSDKTMLNETVRRLRPLIRKNNIYIATHRIYRKNIKNCLGEFDIPAQNIFFEPESKNTLAPIGVLSKKIYAKDKEAVILILPSDHYIKEKKIFLAALNKAIDIAKKGYIVTIGITPDSPETGYGYIKIKSKNKDFCSIERFIEKPDIVRAKKFIQDSRFYWNGGIFVFKAKVMLEEIAKYAPCDYQIITKIKDINLNKLWPRLTSISIDYAIMEKSKRLVLIPADFAWIDLGSWRAIEYFAKKDIRGNIFKGNCIDIDSNNILAWSDKRLLATVGLNNIIIVNTKDAVLVCAKDKTQDVKKIAQILKKKNL